MDFLYKFLVFLVVCCVVAGFCISCFQSPVSAHAELSASDFAQIQYYLESAKQNENAIDFQLSTDEDGNRNVRLQIKTLQDSYFKSAGDFYGQEDFNLSTAPNSVSFGGSYSGGLYVSAIDGQVHSIHNSSFTSSGLVCSSDEFSLYFNSTDSANTIEFTPYIYTSGSGTMYKGTTLSRYSLGDVALTLSQSGNYFSGFPRTKSYSGGTGQGQQFYTYILGSGAPSLLSRSDFNYFFDNGVQIGSAGVSVELPEDDVPTVSPWDYYNDELLPYIKENFDLPNLDDFLVFPDGYQVPNSPINPDFNVPIVAGGGIAAGFVFAPIILGAGAIVDLGGLNFDIYAPIDDFLRVDGINFSFPVDKSITNAVNINGEIHEVPSREPFTIIDIDGNERTLNFTDINHFTIDGTPFVRNLDGTITIDNDITLTLPVGVPETLASGANDLIYAYELPTLEHLNIVDSSLSAPDLSGYATNISTIWVWAKKIYTDSGLLQPLLICLSLSLVGYGLWKIAG